MLATSQFRITGKERDPETGLDHYGARFYRADIGRFASVDPLGIPRDRLADPQQFNLYSYVRNNALIFVDPTGKRLEIVLLNSSSRSNQTATEMGQRAANLYRQAGVMNVSVRVINVVRPGDQASAKDHRVFTEVADFGKGKYLDAGGASGRHDDEHNISIVDSQAKGPAALSEAGSIIKVGNDIAHETAHDEMPGYHPDQQRNSKPDPCDVMLTFTDPGPCAHFTEKEAQRLRIRYNDPNEVPRDAAKQPEKEH